MRSILRFAAPVLALALAASSLSAQTQPAAKAKPAAKTTTAKGFFPYQIHEKKLANGLHVIVVPTPEFKDMVTYSMPVLAGSRNEVHKGKTGLAHLFEHIMFRHEYGGRPGAYSEDMRLMGTYDNAWTNWDLTFYHPTTFSQNLVGPIKRGDKTIAGLIDLQAERFQHLKLDKKTFQVEAGAVLGEYRRIFSDPGESMVEKYSEVAFGSHPYGHTVIGYADDVKNMPEAWDAAWEFFDNYYRPNNVALLVVGDVDPQMIFREAERAYGKWQPKAIPAIPDPPEPTKEQRLHVNWEADVSPRVEVAYHTPAMKPGTREAAVSQILGELLTSRTAPLFQKLRYQKQTVTDFGIYDDSMLQSTSPHLMVLDSTLDLDRFRKEGQKYVDDVTTDVISGVEELQNFSKQKNATETLALIKSKYRNDLLGALDSTVSIAQLMAVNYRFEHDAHALDKMMAALDSLTPADVDAYAKKHFQPTRRVVTTLWKDQAAAAKEAK